MCHMSHNSSLVVEKQYQAYKGYHILFETPFCRDQVTMAQVKNLLNRIPGKSCFQKPYLRKELES